MSKKELTNPCIINWELWYKIQKQKPIQTEYNFKKRMKNKLDEQYINLLKTIKEFGSEKEDRTGTGTRSIFGYTIRHNMADGFPLLTTKKMFWKGIVTEMLWFLQGRTDLRFLLENNCHIWTGDAYKVYDKDFDREHPPFSAPYPLRLTVKEFEEKIMTDDEFNKWYGDLGPIYGKQWRHWTVSINDELDPNRKIPGGYRYSNGEYTETYIDQIANLINDLKTNPDSRRLMVTAWNPAELDQMTLPPCHYGFQVYTRELSLQERLEMIRPFGMDALIPEAREKWMEENNIPTRAISLMWNQRSVDTFLGLPFNIASYGLLLEIIAKEVNMIPDQLIGQLGDVHIYNDHFDQVDEQISREPYELPTINFNTEWWDKPFFEAINNESFCKCLLEEDIQLGNYKSHPAIKANLSN
jgi:thymidylate synthase